MLTNNQKELIEKAIEEYTNMFGLASILNVCNALSGEITTQSIHAYMIELCENGTYAMHKTDVLPKTDEEKAYWLSLTGCYYVGICKR